MYREPSDKNGTLQLSSNSYWRRDHTSSEQMTMLFIRKAQVHLKTYTQEKKIEPPEMYKKDNNQSIDTNQGVNNNQEPKHSIKPPNRLDL